MTKIATSFRLSEASIKKLAKDAKRLGISRAALLELLIRKGA